MSPRRLIATLLALSCLLPGCGDDPPPPPPPSPEPAPPPPPTPAATASATASASAAPSASSPAPIASVEAVSKEPRKWSDYAGPEIEPSVKPGERAWAVVPVSVGWDTLKLRTLDLERLEGHLAIFSLSEDGQKTEYHVPGAFVSPTKPPQKPGPGTPLIASVHGSRAYARVVETKGDKLEVRYQFAGSLEKAELDPRDVLELDGTPRFGAPIAYKEMREGPRSERKIVWHPATFVQASEEKVWLVTSAGKPLRVPRDTVKALGVQLTHKAGDSVWVARGDDLVPGKVLEVLDEALRYRVALEQEQEVTAGFENVAPPVR